MSLTFVLTLALGGTGRPGNDLIRAGMLLDSAVKFINSSDITSFLVITRRSDVLEVSKALDRYRGHLPIEVVDEIQLCPLLESEPETTNKWPSPNVGWVRQQLLKFAVRRLVTTPFYMTLDSDVIFTRPLELEFLLADGKAIVNSEKFSDYMALYESATAEHERSVKSHRYKDASRLLGHKTLTSRLNFWYGETPVIMSCAITEAVTSRIERIWNMSWEEALVKNLPWTEYALYFVHAEESGLFDRYHRIGTFDSLLNMSHSIWWQPERYRDQRKLDDWPVEKIFGGSGPGYAVVVQSYLGYDPVSIRQRIQDFISV